MARAIWSGSISFGLVNVPVKAFTAVRDHDVHFHRLEKGTGARVRNRQVSEQSGEQVASGDVEMGFELTKGHYVTVDPDEIDALRPASTRSIDVGDFVPLEDIDPVYYERTYWLAPDGDAAAASYGLLLAAMVDQQRVGIGTVVMRTKQYLAAIRPLDGALAMSTMRFADEVVDRSEIDALPGSTSEAAAEQLALATQIIEALASDWRPDQYHDTYTDELRDLITRKSEGEEIVVDEAAGDDTSNVIDLMAALQASVDEATARRSGSAGKRSGRARRSSAPATGKAATAKAPARKGASAKKAPAGKAASAGTAPAKKAGRKTAASKRAAPKKASSKKSSATRSAARRSA